MAAWVLAHGLSHLFVTGFVSAARVRGLASSSSSKRDGLDYLPVSLKPNSPPQPGIVFSFATRDDPHRFVGRRPLKPQLLGRIGRKPRVDLCRRRARSGRL